MVEVKPFLRLASREREILILIARGYNAAEIGGRLAISAKTVHSYKARIRTKLGLSHRAHYVQFALRLGLLTGPLGDAIPDDERRRSAS